MRPLGRARHYGQDGRYAARGQEARSRYGQDGRYAARGQEARSRNPAERALPWRISGALSVAIFSAWTTSAHQIDAHPMRNAPYSTDADTAPPSMIGSAFPNHPGPSAVEGKEL